MATSLCPHLAASFQCDKYDIRRCSFKTIVGQNDFYPDIMSCRNGYTYMKEDPEDKYCVVQECRPLEKNGIVEAYGARSCMLSMITPSTRLKGHNDELQTPKMWRDNQRIQIKH